MMRWMIHLSLQFRILVVVIGAVLLFFGIAKLRDMPVGVFPEFSPPYVEIQTEALGLSAHEVESLITLPLEELLIRTPWLKTMRSRSVTGLSSILIIFESGTDIMVARQLVQERITSARKLPNVSKAPVM
ncbi:MAG: efflux RND transporter permease subunit, partial [Ignavibacteria bacterium]|nr:efflux RND transporter permease subunit [Ignavibacteria bacterium]